MPLCGVRPFDRRVCFAQAVGGRKEGREQAPVGPDRSPRRSLLGLWWVAWRGRGGMGPGRALEIEGER